MQRVAVKCIEPHGSAWPSEALALGQETAIQVTGSVPRSRSVIENSKECRNVDSKSNTPDWVLGESVFLAAYLIENPRNPALPFLPRLAVVIPAQKKMKMKIERAPRKQIGADL